MIGLCSPYRFLICAAEQRRIDAFQNYCLRQILRIPSAYISRVSNAEVLRRSGQVLLSKAILKSQLELLGHIALLPETDPLRAATFHRSGFRPSSMIFVRKRGRPRHNWTEQLLQLARSHCGPGKLEENIQDEELWRQVVLRAMS